MMRKHHRYLFDEKLRGKKFWSGGYFYRSVGVVNKATVKRYIEFGQEKHWIAIGERAYGDKAQRTLAEFAS